MEEPIFSDTAERLRRAYEKDQAILDIEDTGRLNQ